MVQTYSSLMECFHDLSLTPLIFLGLDAKSQKQTNKKNCRLVNLVRTHGLYKNQDLSTWDFRLQIRCASDFICLYTALVHSITRICVSVSEC